MLKQMMYVMCVLVCVGQLRAETVFFDDGFPRSSLDSRWTSQVSGNGSLVVADSKVALQGAVGDENDGGHTRLAATSSKNAATDGGTYASGNYLRLTADINSLTNQWSFVGISDMNTATGQMNGGIRIGSRNTDVWADIAWQYQPDSWAFAYWTIGVDESNVAGTWTVDWYTDRVVIKQNGNLRVDSATSSPYLLASGWTVSGVLDGLKSINMAPAADCGGSSAGTVVLDRVQWSAAVPEPGTLALFSTGLLGLLAYAWRRRK